eukprot:scaffold63581_cov51-Phaeocystis_antarctica.AAC.2
MANSGRAQPAPACSAWYMHRTLRPSPACTGSTSSTASSRPTARRSPTASRSTARTCTPRTSRCSRRRCRSESGRGTALL